MAETRDVYVSAPDSTYLLQYAERAIQVLTGHHRFAARNGYTEDGGAPDRVVSGGEHIVSNVGLLALRIEALQLEGTLTETPIAHIDVTEEEEQILRCARKRAIGALTL